MDPLQSMPSYHLVGVIEVPGQVPLLVSDTDTEKGAHVEQGRPWRNVVFPLWKDNFFHNMFAQHKASESSIWF